MLKFTHYFEAVRQRADRAVIRVEWIQHLVVLLADGETVHNAFFDRSFTP
jgi:hypothetical protein